MIFLTMSDYKKINLAFLENFTKNDRAKMSKYITMFLNSAPEAILTMKRFHTQEDWTNLRTVAHSLKPQFAYMGIDSLKEPILRIEEYAGEGKHPDIIADLINMVDIGCNEAFEELQDAVKKLS